MFSRNMQMIYRRLMILGLLSMCLFVFGYSDNSQTVQANLLCAQDCDRYFEMCNDSCQGQCGGEGSTDESCNTCLTNCADQWNSCSSRATYCSSGGTISYDPQCTTDYGRHCINLGGGLEDCSDAAGAHNGYSETCNRIGYENGCVVCPDGEICHGSNPGQPPQCL